MTTRNSIHTRRYPGFSPDMVLSWRKRARTTGEKWLATAPAMLVGLGILVAALAG